jgi:hypothetical protein
MLWKLPISSKNREEEEGEEEVGNRIISMGDETVSVSCPLGVTQKRVLYDQGDGARSCLMKLLDRP